MRMPLESISKPLPGYQSVRLHVVKYSSWQQYSCTIIRRQAHCLAGRLMSMPAAHPSWTGWCRGFELPARCRRLNAWYADATKRSSVQKTLKAPEGAEYETALLEHYSKYADSSANSTSAKDFK